MVSSRQACTFKEVTVKHAVCGAFLHFLRQLEAVAPASKFSEMQEALRRQFQSGYLDADLTHVCETQVPPASLHDVGGFRLGLKVKGGEY